MTSTFAVVVAGGGPRGAYEAGMLSVLLPALEAGGMKADVFVGTSAGAINAVGFAALSHLGAAAASAAVLDLWREIRAASVFRLPLSAARTGPAAHRRAGALLDTSPLLSTLDRIVDWKRLHANIRSGSIAAVGVVATSSSTRDSTVFLETAPHVVHPDPDPKRAIAYVPTTIGPRHVLASSAIPVAFPAVEVTDPAVAAGWYADGGVRLNTPIKPAIALGARRVLVVATSPAHTEIRAPVGPSSPPGIAAGAAELLYAILDDRMVEDLRALARRNEPDVDGKLIQWTFGGPGADDAGLLGRLACEVLEGAGRGSGRPHGALAVLARRALGRALAGDPSRGEAFSYAFFDADFIDGAIRLGERDGRRLLGLDGMPVWHGQGGGDKSAP